MTARGRKRRLVYGNERPCVFGAGLTPSTPDRPQPTRRVRGLVARVGDRDDAGRTGVVRVWPPPSPVRAVLIMRFDCESGRKGAEQAGRKLMDSGEASTYNGGSAQFEWSPRVLCGTPEADQQRRGNYDGRGRHRVLGECAESICGEV